MRIQLSYNQLFTYPYSFQAQEHDDEVNGDGNSLNYKYRMHDPRLGRFFAIDPLAKKYSYNSPYSFSENKLIDGIELEGLEHFYSADGKLLGVVGTSTDIRILHSDATFAETNLKYIQSEESGSYQGSLREQYLLENSTLLIKQDQLWSEIKKWGDNYAPKSENQEYAVSIYSIELSNSDGKKFNAFVFGSSVPGTKEDSDPEKSRLELGPDLIAGQEYDSEMGFSYTLKSPWDRYATVHTHPSGSIERQKFSTADMTFSLKNHTDSYMFPHDTKSLIKFDPGKYKKASGTYEFRSMEYPEGYFDDYKSKATTEFENVRE